MAIREYKLDGKLITSSDPSTIGGKEGSINFRQLTNMRYTDTNPQGVKGHSLINTTALKDAAGPTNYYHIQNGFHFRKSVPSSESHVVVQATKTDNTVPKLFKNDTAIPSQGQFTTTQIYTEDSSAGVGVFSEAPDGFMAYTNGKETLAWGGTEARCARFIHFDPSSAPYKWDYTSFVSNTLTSDVATLNKKASSATDEVLLLHMDGTDGGTTFTDSSAKGNTFTASGNANTDDAQKKFGTTSGYFDGTGDFISRSDDVDFDFSSGSFSIDFWFKPNWIDPDTGIGSSEFVYYQGTTGSEDTDYFAIYIEPNALIFQPPYYSGALVGVQYEVAGSSVIGTFIGEVEDLSIWNHVQITRDGTTWRLFINGSLADSAAVAAPVNHNSDIVIGGDGGITTEGADYKGWIDEFHILNGGSFTPITSNFTPYSSAYPVSEAEIYVGSVLPIQGAKFYINDSEKNDTAATTTVAYWSGSGWTSVSSLSDGTSSANKSLAQTGSITFTSTVSTAKVRSVDSISLYWYKFNFGSIDDGTKIYQVTLDIPTQTIKDIWDGEFRTVLAFMEWDNSGAKFYDHTIGVFEDFYDSADSGTRAKLEQATSTTWDTTNDYLLVASAERLSGFNFNMVSPQENTATASMAISYWAGDQWISVGVINDNTLETGKTLAKSGIVTWNPPASTAEFTRMDLSVRRKAPEKKTGQRTVDQDEGYEGQAVYEEYQYWGSKADKRLSEDIAKRPFDLKQFGYPLYFYKITFNGQIRALANNVEIFYIGAIPAQTDIRGYSHCSFHQDRLFLSDDTVQHRNSEICSTANTLNVFNGFDSRVFRYGDESPLTVGVSMAARYKDGLNAVRAVFKKDETWLLTGYNSQNWRKTKISGTKGCVAPLTAQVCDITVDGVVTQVVIFQGANGLHMFDGTTVINIDMDIDDVFKPESTTKVNTDVIDKNVGFYDPHKEEYHWLWASGESTTLDKEYVFDVGRLQWFEINRGTAAALQCGFAVQDTTGNSYIYGGIDTGHLMRLGNGTAFANTTGENTIAHTMWLADMFPEKDSFMVRTRIRNVGLLGVAKSTTSETIAVTHYGDTKTSGTSFTSAQQYDPTKSGYRLFGMEQKSGRSRDELYSSHSLKFEISTDDETIGFEPLKVGINYRSEREKD